MSEYMSGPDVQKALKANNDKCAKWASKTAGHTEEFKIPFGVRSDVGDNDFYKLQPGEEDEIECGSMGVPDHERAEMEAMMGMHHYPMGPLPMGGRRRRRHSHGYMPVIIPGLPGPMPMGPPPPPGTFFVQPASPTPPPSAGFSTRRRSGSRAAPPAPLPLHLSIPSHHPSPAHSPVHSPSGRSGSPFFAGSPAGGPPLPFMAPSSRPVSPLGSPDGHHHHKHHHHHGHSHSHHKKSRSHSRHGRSPPAYYMVSPPNSGSPVSPPVMSSGIGPGYNIYMPHGAGMMRSPMQFAAVY